MRRISRYTLDAITFLIIYVITMGAWYSLIVS